MIFDVSITDDCVPVRPELVEGQVRVGAGATAALGIGFDKALLSNVEGLSPNGD
jgi:hypothetical protein